MHEKNTLKTQSLIKIKFFFCKMVLIPFINYTMIIETLLLSSGQALLSGIPPLKSFLAIKGVS